ncbi:hypothetical protein HK101_000577 [Irineochytrium annulatum]|nr:hypothetical protein HK101_000577 [Irineochytrium annulatum]
MGRAVDAIMTPASMAGVKDPISFKLSSPSLDRPATASPEPIVAMAASAERPPATDSPSPLTIRPIPLRLLKTVILKALRRSLRTAFLTHTCKSLTTFALTIVRLLLRRRPLSLSHFPRLLWKSLVAPATIRFTALTSVFSLLWHVLRPTLRGAIPFAPPLATTFASGAIAAAGGLMMETRDARVEWMQMGVVRGGQALGRCIGSGKGGWGWVRWPKDMDGLVFVVFGGCVMYAITVYPETLERGYHRFLCRTAGLEPTVLAVNSHHLRSLPPSPSPPPLADAHLCLTLISHHAGPNAPTAVPLAASFLQSHANRPPYMPCWFGHSSELHCGKWCLIQAWGVFQRIWALNAALNGASLGMYLRKAYLRGNVADLTGIGLVKHVARAVASTVSSSAFLASCAGVFQGGMCAHRQFLDRGWIERDSQIVYLLVGFLGASSIFLERKGRRAELAAYMVGKGGESLWSWGVINGIWRDMAGLEVVVGALGLGTLVMLHEHERDKVMVLFSKAMDFFIGA